MPSSKSKSSALSESGNPDETYDIFDYEEEITDDDGERFAIEGILRQQDQPQARQPLRNVYIEKMSQFMKRGGKVETASEKDVASPSRCLISHDFVTTLSPELAASFDKKVTSPTKWIKERAAENVEALEALLARVPDGQHDLHHQISGILSKERQNEKDAGEVEKFMEVVKEKKYTNPMNRAWKILKGEH